MVKERFYYTLNELQDPSKLTFNFKTLFDYWSVSYAEGINTVALYSHIEEKYGDEVIAYIDIEHSDWEIISKPTYAEIIANDDYSYQINKQLKKIKGWLDDSQFRFDKLISLYNAEQNNLMNKISSVSTSQFNDTPQTTATGLDADSYATTYTKNTSSSDAGTVMQRLAEIRALWNSIYGEWEAEFGRKFVMYI